MPTPDDLPEELEGDFHAGEIQLLRNLQQLIRTAPECVERDRYEDYASLWDDLEDLTGWDITEEGDDE